MVKVLKKTFDFLEIIADRSKISLSNLAQETGLQRSAVYHVLNSLVELGYLHKSHEGMYSLGDRLFRLTGLTMARPISSPLTFSIALAPRRPRRWLPIPRIPSPVWTPC